MPMGIIYKAKRPVGRPRTRKRQYKRRAPAPPKKRIQHWGGKFPSVHVQGLGQILPARKLVRLKYVQSIAETVDPSGAPPDTGALDSFALNGLSVVNETGTTHQCIGWDEITEFYDNYKVYGATVEVVFAVNTACTYKCGLYALASHSTLPTDFDKMIEKVGAKWRYGSSNDGPVKLKCYYKLSDMFGLTKSQYRNERNYASGKGANPGDVSDAYKARVTPFLIHTDETTSINVAYTVTIIYDVMLWGPEYLVQS